MTPNATEEPGRAEAGGAERAASHLRALPLARVLRTAWEKYPRFGLGARIGGDLDPAEQRALESLLGEPVRSGRSIPLARIDAALRSSAFGCGLPEALAAAFGAFAVPAAVAAAERDQGFRTFKAAVADAWPPEVLARPAPEGALRREFLRCHAGGPARLAELTRTARAVGRALHRLRTPPPGPPPPLPVLANLAAGDPHAFDQGAPGGRLLLAGLGGDPSAGAAERQALFAMAGLAVDGVSSTVAVWGVAPGDDPSAAAAAAAGLAHIAPLRHVCRWGFPRSAWEDRVVHAVENPAVFEALVDREPPGGTALLCTSGFPSAAGLTALRRLGEAGARLRYGGDFDANGLMIAGRVAAVFGARAELWRMCPEDYRTALRAGRGRPLRPDERRALEALAATGGSGEGPGTPPCPDGLRECAAAVLDGGNAAYQESLLPDLWSDLAAH